MKLKIELKYSCIQVHKYIFYSILRIYHQLIYLGKRHKEISKEKLFEEVSKSTEAKSLEIWLSRIVKQSAQ